MGGVAAAIDGRPHHGLTTNTAAHGERMVLTSAAVASSRHQQDVWLDSGGQAGGGSTTRHVGATARARAGDGLLQPRLVWGLGLGTGR